MTQEEVNDVNNTITVQFYYLYTLCPKYVYFTFLSSILVINYHCPCDSVLTI